MKRLKGSVTKALLLLCALFVVFAGLVHAGQSGFRYCRVERVIDGDTFVCSGERVRLIGVDTPESFPNERAESQAGTFGDLKTVLELGRRAKAFTEWFLERGTTVGLEFDVQVRDRYGRLLAYVWLPDGRMLNELLLRSGYAVLYTVPPNVKYEALFREAQRDAQRSRRGLWGVVR